MSHEIRTPMTAILGYTDLLHDCKRDESEGEQYIQTIRNNGEHLLAIINDILDLSKIEAHKMEVENIPCSVIDIINEVIELMKVRAMEQNINIDLQYEVPLPEVICSDPIRIRQILMNLVGNAIKFTEVGSVQITVKPCSLDTNSCVSMIVIDVVDTGIGMDKEHIDRLFRPFSQADSSNTRKFGGTGLGLAISKRLAKMLGGDIKVQSTLGKGSTFSLNVATGTSEKIKMITSIKELKNPKKQNRSVRPVINLEGRVLLVEDNPVNRIFVRKILSKCGLSIEEVENGAEGYDQAMEAWGQDQPYDLILMDMHMPIMDGYEATQKLRDAGYAKPIVALTANAMSSDRKKCLAVGCDEFTTKPINKEKLFQILQLYIKPTSNTVEVAL